MGSEADGAALRPTLVLFPGALGDAVCFEPAAAWLAREAPVVFCARGAAAEVAALFPCRPATCSLDAPEVARLFAPLGDRATTSDWLAEFGRVLSLTGASSVELRARVAAAGGVVASFPRRAGPGHAIDEMLRLVHRGAAPLRATPRLRLDRAAPARVDPRRLVIHPGSGGAAKRAPRRVFVEVSERWRARGGEVTIVLGPAESAESEWWERQGQGVSMPRSIAELAQQIAGARLYVGNDSGPSHVAAALGAATIVVFRASDPQRFGPRGGRVRHVFVSEREPQTCTAVWRAVEAVVP